MELGGEVGYHVRFDRRAGPRTRDPLRHRGPARAPAAGRPVPARASACVVLDEFHERSLDADLSLALVRRVQLEARADLRLVAMSATLDAEAVAAYLGGAPIVRSRGAPVPGRGRAPAAPRRASGPRQHARARRAPGAGRDSRRRAGLPAGRRRDPPQAHAALVDLERGGRAAAARALRRPARRGAGPGARARHGPQGRARHERGRDRRSPCAGVTAVVDTGLARDPRATTRPWASIACALKRISQAAAEQRKGRAGREAAGLCLRLFSLAEERSLAPFERPAIAPRRPRRRRPRSSWPSASATSRASPGSSAPPPAALAAALALARALGAVDHSSTLTDDRPRAGAHPGPAAPGALAASRATPWASSTRRPPRAALLGERDPWRRPDPARGAQAARPTRSGSESDVLDRVRALFAFERDGPRAGTGAAPWTRERVPRRACASSSAWPSACSGSRGARRSGASRRRPAARPAGGLPRPARPAPRRRPAPGRAGRRPRPAPGRRVRGRRRRAVPGRRARRRGRRGAGAPGLAGRARVDRGRHARGARARLGRRGRARAGPAARAARPARARGRRSRARRTARPPRRCCSAPRAPTSSRPSGSSERKSPASRRAGAASAPGGRSSRSRSSTGPSSRELAAELAAGLPLVRRPAPRAAGRDPARAPRRAPARGARARGARAHPGAEPEQDPPDLRPRPPAGARGAHPGALRPARDAARRGRARQGAAAPARAQRTPRSR